MNLIFRKLHIDFPQVAYISFIKTAEDWSFSKTDIHHQKDVFFLETICTL
jgi:hypothetical protein